MSQYRCGHCGSLKQEPEITIVHRKQNGRIIRKYICTNCLSRTLPNPLRKVVVRLWIVIACLTGIVCYFLAYKIF